jgi:hypothetical protein
MIVKNRIHQWGGAAFMLGNVLFLANKFNDMSRLFLSRPMADVISGQNLLLIFIGQVALIIGYVAFLKTYSQRVSPFGKIALRLFSGGGIVLAIGHVSFMSALADYLPPAIFSYVEAFFFAVLIGTLLVIVGLAWFGVLNLRHPVLGRWQWLPLTTGVMGFIGFFLLRGQEITAFFLVFRTLFALGLIGLGLILWLEKTGLAKSLPQAPASPIPQPGTGN